MNLKRCKKCELIKTCNCPVNGEGSDKAKIMLIGEAPGANEDRQGMPFCGAAGRKLEELLEVIGLNRNEVYITNIVKCRPPKNVDPTDKQIRRCSRYLHEEIRKVKPKIIITLGRFAGDWVAERLGLKFGSISSMHGKTYSVKTLTGTVRVLFMYHPACALYNPKMIKVLKKDIKRIKKYVWKNN